MNMLELNYRYGTGFIKLDAENTIRKKIQELSLKIIKYNDLDDLVKEWKQERNELYNILNMKPRLFLLRGEK